MSMTGATLSRAYGGSVSLASYNDMAAEVEEALRLANCTTPKRAAMFFAQTGTESAGLKWMTELASGAEYEGRKDLGNTQPGDGRRFKGRGPIQITGRYNYTQVSAWAHSIGKVPTSTFFVDHPEKLAQKPYRFLGVVWYWTKARNMNAYADKGDVRGATLAVNGGLNGYADRLRRYNAALKLGNALVPGGSPAPSKQVFAFPLPRGHWFGVNDKTLYSHSGRSAADRAYIKKVQAKVGLPSAQCDGVFGLQTKAAVVQWQAAHNLTADGKVGPATWKAMGY